MPSGSFRSIATAVNSPRVIFLVALTARLWVLSQLLPANPWRDFYQYNEPSHIACSMVSGAGYSSPWGDTLAMPTAQQPPLYPYLIAGIFKLAGTYSYLSLWIALGLNAVFSALTAVVIFHLGQKTFNTPTGVLAAWIWSCWIYEAVVSIRLWESSLSALLLTTGLWLLPKLAGSLRQLFWIIFGALVGVSALTNTSLLSVFSFFWLWLWLGYRRRGFICTKWLVASVIICVLVLLPWTVRNYETFHQLMPIRDNFGLELWIGNHEGKARLNGDDFQLMVAEYSRLGEMRFMDTKRQLAVQFILQHPGSFLHLSAQRFYKFWSAPDGSVWILVSLLAWLGMFVAIRRKGFEAVPYVIVLVVFPLVYYLTHTGSTYRHPAEPAILVLAAYSSVSAAGVLRQTIARDRVPIHHR
jgi:hypothetical protein